MMARLTRYSLRTLLVLFVASGIVLAIYSNYANGYQDEQSALKVLTSSASNVQVNSLVQETSNAAQKNGSTTKLFLTPNSKPIIAF